MKSPLLKEALLQKGVLFDVTLKMLLCQIAPLKEQEIYILQDAD